MPLYLFDQAWRNKGFHRLAGVDEAGRGPWAGPVVAAAVILPPEGRWPTLNDSKKLTPLTRDRLFHQIRLEALAHAVVMVPAGQIDRVNILNATFLAMRQALAALAPPTPDLVLVDGNLTIRHYLGRQEPIVKGDGLSASIAAASVLAKVTRDRWMERAHEQYPHYHFHRNKGYGTADHRDALRRFGPCDLHRQSYAPVREVVGTLFPLSSQ